MLALTGSLRYYFVDGVTDMRLGQYRLCKVICVTIRRYPEWTDEEKDGLVKEGKMVKGKVKDTVFLILANKGIKVV